MAARLVTPNLAWLPSGVTITATASATGYPASNLLSTSRTAVWRSTTTTGDQNVEIDIPSSLVRAMVAINFKLHVGGALTPQYWTGSAWANLGVVSSYTIPSSNRTRLVAAFDATGKTTTKVRFYFTNTASASDYVELGIGWVSTYVEPSQSVQPGPSISPVDPSLVGKAEGGQRHTWVRQRYQAPHATYAPLGTSDRDSILQVFDANGIGTPIVWAIDPTNPDLIWYGSLPAQPAVSHLPNSQNLWSIDVAFEEDV